MKNSPLIDKKIQLTSLELFAGAGGLALGISNAHFKHLAVIERDKKACDNIRENQHLGVSPLLHWPLHELDIREFDYSPFENKVDLVSGGPPCQPFSLGGKHKGPQDTRDMFPEAVRAIRELSPKAFFFENVRGLLRESFSSYFEYIILQLSYPNISKRESESWVEHRSRLEKHHTSTKEQPSYKIVFGRLNAADFGVPQKRERVIIIGFKSELNVEWSFPIPTHTSESLLWSQYVTGEYWDRHEVSKKERPALSDRLRTKIDSIRSNLFPPDTLPWLTIRDAICDLPKPTKIGNPSKVSNHIFMPGARIYTGHTGSPIDEPAKTLKAGDHGVPGGENTLVLPCGEVRYFTVRESARLQNFPDEYLFHGSWTESMRQLGNAVPVKLGSVVAKSIKQKLNDLL